MARIKLFQNLDCGSARGCTVATTRTSPSPPWGTGVARFLTSGATSKDCEDVALSPASARVQSNASTRCPSPATRCPSPTRPSSASVSSRAPTRPSSAFSVGYTPRQFRGPSVDLGDGTAGDRPVPSGRPLSAIQKHRPPRPGSASERGTASARAQPHRPATAPQKHVECMISRGKIADDIDLDLPEWYLLDGELQPESGTLLPDHDLWLTLRGGNGTWRRQRAREEWQRRKVEHAERSRAKELEQRYLQARRAEAEAGRRAADEELRTRVEEADREKRRRQEEEALLQLDRVEVERRRRLDESRRWKLRQPRVCEVCGGSGKCISCVGKGCAATFYFVPCVKNRNNLTHGSLPRGCSTCGGSGDNASWGVFVCGSGRCACCAGKGQVRPPNGEWPE